MEKGRLIVIEGTDCSGKETQSNILLERLNNEGIPTKKVGFPNYDSPSGKIVGLPFLGKSYLANELIMNNLGEVIENVKKTDPNVDNNTIINVLKSLSDSLSKGWFKEGAPNVNPKVSSLYYAADRLYNVDTLYEYIDSGINVILDRYIYSNMAHQGSKILDEKLRIEMYKWIADLEFGMLNLPKSDIRLFLHMPNEYANILRRGREESLDENEKDSEYMLRSEKAYVEVANLYDFDTIKCVEKRNDNVVFEDIKTPENINSEVYNLVKSKIIGK